MNERGKEMKLIGIVGIIYFGTIFVINVFRLVEEIKRDKLISKLRYENRKYLVDNEVLLRQIDSAKIFNKEAEKLKELIKTKAIVEYAETGYNIIIKCDNDEASKFFNFIHEEEIPEDVLVISDEV